MTEKTKLMQPEIPAPLQATVEGAKRELARLGGFALLIGVEQYDDDAITNLRAGRNDVLAYWKVCRRLGYRRIRLVTSPKVTVDQLVDAEMELAFELDKERKNKTEGQIKEELRIRVQGWLDAFEAHQADREPPRITRAGLQIDIVDRARRTLGDDLHVGIEEATSANVTNAVRWLADRLTSLVSLTWNAGGEERRRWEQWPAFPGFLAYSGHGARSGKELLLCPADTRASAFEKAISFPSLRALFDGADDLHTVFDQGSDPKLMASLAALRERVRRSSELPGGCDPADNLTVVLDCCFAGGSASLDKPHQVPTLTPGRLSRGEARLTQTKLASRVFCAAARGETAYQALLGGHWHGAFTWAFTTALEQWSITRGPNGEYRRSNITHAELLFRARALLEALSFPQHPVFLDTVSNRPVFWHDTEALGGGEEKYEPTEKRPGVQTDPTGEYAHYQIFDDSGVLLAEIISTKTSDTGDSGMLAGTEYWKISGRELDSSRCTKITKTVRKWSDRPAYSKHDASFSCGVEWSSLTRESAPVNMAFRQVDGDGGFYAALAFDGSDWTGQLHWVKVTSNEYLFMNLPDGGASLGEHATPEGSTFYRVPLLETITPTVTEAIRGGGTYCLRLLREDGQACYARNDRGTARWTATYRDAGWHRAHQQDAQSRYQLSCRRALSGVNGPPLKYNAQYDTSQGIWRFERLDPPGGGGPLRTGERIRIHFEGHGGRYLSAQKDGTLDVRAEDDLGDSHGIIWVLLPPLA